MSLNFSVVIGAVIALVGVGLGFYGGLYIGERRIPTVKPDPVKLKLVKRAKEEPLLDPISPTGGVRRVED